MEIMFLNIFINCYVFGEDQYHSQPTHRFHLFTFITYDQSKCIPIWYCTKRLIFSTKCDSISVQVVCYPQMPIGKVWIYRLLFFVCVFVWKWISPSRIKLVVSHLARWFIGVQGKESQIVVNSAPPESQNQTNRKVCMPQPPGCKHYHRVEILRRKLHNFMLEMCCSVASACVDICQSLSLTYFCLVMNGS